MPSTERVQMAKAMNKTLQTDEKSIDEELEADQRAAERERAKDTKAQADVALAQAESAARALSPQGLLEQNQAMKAQLDALQATIARMTPAGAKEVLYTFPGSPRDTPSARLYEMFPDGNQYPGGLSPAQARSQYVREQWGLSQDGKPHDRVWD